MPTSARAVRIVKAKLGNEAGMIGAGLLVKEEFLKEELHAGFYK